MRAFVSPTASVALSPLCLPCSLFCGNTCLYVSLLFIEAYECALILYIYFCDMDWPPFRHKVLEVVPTSNQMFTHAYFQVGDEKK